MVAFYRKEHFLGAAHRRPHLLGNTMATEEQQVIRASRTPNHTLELNNALASIERARAPDLPVTPKK